MANSFVPLEPRPGPVFARATQVGYSPVPVTGPASTVTQPSALGALRATFAMLAQKPAPIGDIELLALQRRVCAVVDEMKGAGALPERVVVTVRRLATDSGVHWRDNKLFDQLVNWCVDHYYRSGDTPG